MSTKRRRPKLLDESNEQQKISELYVLGKPLKEEQVLIDEAIKKAVDALKEILKNNFDSAMNKYNH